MGHFKSFHRNGTDTSKIRLIALTLKDGFLSELDPVLLLHLTDHVLQELQLILLLDDFGIDFDLDLLLEALFVVLVAGHLRENLQAFEHSSSETLHIEVITVLL